MALKTGASWVLLVLLAFSFYSVIAASAFAATADEINVLPNLDPLNRAEGPLSNGGKWSALAWDTSSSGHNTGNDTTGGWSPYDAFSTVNGAYWTPSIVNDKTGEAAAVTMQASPGISERYVALWLDMPNPGSVKTGYQLRWTMVNASTNAYSVTLSKWSSGSQTVLASNASVVVAPGTTMAISDTGGTVSAWQGAGGSLVSILSASDSTLGSGYVGIEASGTNSRSLNFKAGRLLGGAVLGSQVLDSLERQEVPLATGKWSKLSWAGEIGGAWMGSYRGYGSSSGLAGAYWNATSFSDAQEGDLVAATVGTGATPEGQYLALWLDMPTPGSVRSGYEARFTGTNGTSTAYKVELSKWVSGTRTVLASTSGFSLAVGTTIALSEAGGSVALWTGTSSLSPVLSAYDSTYTSGYAGLEVNGGAGTIYNFRAGNIYTPPPDTTISGGPKGVVVPNVSFSFTATESGATFECSLDGATYGACASPASYQALTEGSHTFKVRAVGAGGRDETPAERSFQVLQTAKATSKVALLDNLERQEVPLATSKWSKTSWAGEIGGAWMGSYRGYGSSSGLAGAFWNPTSFSDNGESVLTAATVGTGATTEGEYLALWLDMPNPGSERSGYEARFTGTNGTSTAYKVELSKWVSGTRTVLASTSGFSLSVGTTIALTETAGGSLALWTGTSTMTPTLTSSDATYTSGYTGLEVNGGAGTLYNFRAGRIDIQAPNTTILSGPSGVVLPENVSFSFVSSENGSSFECSLDSAAYSVCASPKAYPGLVSGSSHTFRVRAIDAVGNQDLTPAERSFQVVSPPTVTTAAATAVKANEATLHATVNPKGAETTYQFEYGTTTSYGSKVPTTPKGIGSGSTSIEISEPASGLQAGTTYHFRISATNAAGTSRGEDRTFTTTAAPTATTDAATNVSAKGATLNAKVNPKGAETTYQFEYGMTTAYGARIPATAKAIGWGTSIVAVSEIPTGLAEGTTYHYRVVATNEVGTTYGTDQKFTTPQLPTVVTEAATNVSGMEAEFHATIDPNGYATTYQFEYGTTVLYGSIGPLAGGSAGVGTSPVDASELVEKLQPNTIYHYRIVATSSIGTATGEDKTFTTTEQSASEGKEEFWSQNEGTGTNGAFTSAVGVGGGKPVGPPNNFVNLMWGGGHENTGEEMEAIGRMGAKMLRLELQPYSEPKNEPGFTQNVFERAANHGITILPYLYGGRLPERAKWAEYDAWVEEQVKMYGPKGTFWNGRVNKAPATYWEVWNEPNRGFNNVDGKHVNAPEFGEFLKVTAEAISRASNGEAKVILGGLLTVKTQKPIPDGSEDVVSPETFLKEMGNNGSYVALGFHPYTFKAKPDSQTGPKNRTEVKEITARIKTDVKAMRLALNEVGGKDKPMWITELGWPIEFPQDTAHASAANEQIQGELINYTFDMLKEEANELGIRNVFYYNDRDSGYQSWDSHCGLRKLAGGFRYAAHAFEAEAEGNQWPVPSHVKTKGHTQKSRRATLFGNVNPEGLLTKYHFEYGTNVYYGKSTPEEDAGYEQEIEVNSEAINLTPSTLYHYRIAATNENGEPSWGEDEEFETPPSTETFATVVSHNGEPGWVTVDGHVYGDHTMNNVYVNINFWKEEGGKFVFQNEESTHAEVTNDYYLLEKWGIGQGKWLVVVVFPGFGEDELSESKEHEFTIQAIPTETFLTLDKYVNGTPGTASVSGNVFHNGSPIDGTVNVNFEKLVSGSWQTMSTAQRTLSNGHYEVINWGVGVGQWRVRAVFTKQNEYAQSESNYHEFSIQPVSTETFLTLDNTVNGTPGTASVSGNVLHNGSGVSGTVNVNFEKWNGASWQPMSTAQRTLSNGHYEVVNWGVGVGQWRVRAVFPEQGDYTQSESSYHEFSIQPVPTEAFLTVDKVVKGTPGTVSVSGNVLHNGSGVSGTVNVNFEKWNGASWQPMSTAQRTLSNGHYEVVNWGVGAGKWRVRVVFPEQGDYAESISGYHEFTI